LEFTSDCYNSSIPGITQIYHKENNTNKKTLLVLCQGLIIVLTDCDSLGLNNLLVRLAVKVTGKLLPRELLIGWQTIY